MPNIQFIEMDAFSHCTNLTSIEFSQVQKIPREAFGHCYSLAVAKFPIIKEIEPMAFYNCLRLISLYLNSISSVPILGSYVFYSTPIGGYSNTAGQYGSVYVPASLYSDFLVAPYWSDIASRIVSL